MKNGKGVSWFDDCRIPTGDSDKYDLEQREVSKAHGVQNDDSFLDQIHDKINLAKKMQRYCRR